jgi:metal-dependent hydrolase (beta-lactamase superfamily II)
MKTLIVRRTGELRKTLDKREASSGKILWVPTIYTVAGGFHLVVSPPDEVQRLVTFLQAILKIKRVAPFHLHW